MAKTIDRTLPIKRYQKIVATVDLPGVPEGTTGKVLVSNGVTWYRYWVDFDNGVRLGQVGHQQVCLANDWDSFRICLLYTSPSPRDLSTSRMPSSA